VKALDADRKQVLGGSCHSELDSCSCLLVENEIKVFKCSIKIRMFAKSKKIV
jgi:hypothetical protein